MITVGSHNISAVNLTAAETYGRIAKRLTASTPCTACELCGRGFYTKASRIAKGRGRFCSAPCANKVKAVAAFSKFWKGEANGNFKGWASRRPRVYVNRFRAKYPEKAAAHDAVKAALRSGVIARPAACEQCGQPPAAGKSLHGHHDDYRLLLTVRWLCQPCHLAFHAEADGAEGQSTGGR